MNSNVNVNVNAKEILNYTNLILLKEVEKLRLAGLDVTGQYHAARPDWRWTTAHSSARFNTPNGNSREPTYSTSSLPSTSTNSGPKITLNGSTYGTHVDPNPADERDSDYLVSSHGRMEELSQPKSKYQVMKRLLTQRQTTTPPGSPEHSAKAGADQQSLNFGVLRVAKIENPRALAVSGRLKIGSGKKSGQVRVHFEPGIGERGLSQDTDRKALTQSQRDYTGGDADSSDETAQQNGSEWNEGEQYGYGTKGGLKLQISARSAPRLSLKYTTSSSLNSGTPRHVSSQTAKRNRALLAGLVDDPDESTSVPRFPIFRCVEENVDASGTRSSASDRDGIPGPSNSLADFSTLGASQDTVDDGSSRTETPTDRLLPLDDETFRNQHKIAYVRALNMATQKKMQTSDYWGQRISTRSFSYFSLLRLDRTPININATRKTRRSARSTPQTPVQKAAARNAKRNVRPASRIFGRIDVDSYLPSARPPPSSLVIT